jgi:hypothetical protein
MNFITFIFLGSLIFSQSVASNQQKTLTTAQVNGTWQSNFGIFKIWELGNRSLKVEFSGIYLYKLENGKPMANTGEGRGIAIITGDRATFKPEGAEQECLIKMVFAEDRLNVEQEGICGFGLNVTATGTYRKVSARQPKFEDD